MELDRDGKPIFHFPTNAFSCYRVYTRSLGLDIQVDHLIRRNNALLACLASVVGAWLKYPAPSCFCVLSKHGFVMRFLTTNSSSGLLDTRNVEKQTWWGYFHVYSKAHSLKIIAAGAEKQELLIVTVANNGSSSGHCVGLFLASFQGRLPLHFLDCICDLWTAQLAQRSHMQSSGRWPGNEASLFCWPPSTGLSSNLDPLASYIFLIIHYMETLILLQRLQDSTGIHKVKKWKWL